MPPLTWVAQILHEIAVISSVVWREHPPNAEGHRGMRLKHAQETVFAIVVDVAEVLVLHSVPIERIFDSRANKLASFCNSVLAARFRGGRENAPQLE